MAGSTYQKRVERYAVSHGMTTDQARQAIYRNRLTSKASRLPGATIKQLRGHGQAPEHARGILPRQKHLKLSGRTLTGSYSDSVVEKVIAKAAASGNRVQLEVHIKGEGWRSLGGKRGYSAQMVANEQAAAGGIRNAVPGLPGGGLPGGGSDDLSDIDPADIDAWWVDNMEV